MKKSLFTAMCVVTVAAFTLHQDARGQITWSDSSVLTINTVDNSLSNAAQYDQTEFLYCGDPADFDGDCRINFNDLAIMSQSWLSPARDSEPGRRIGIEDLEMLANKWLLSW